MQPAYDSMTYRRCGRSGLMLPGISLGCWHNFGGQADLDVARQMLRRAFELGVTHFDLANNYGPPPGSAETNVGRLLKEDFKAHRDELIISSKAGFGMWSGPYGDWGSRKYLIASCDQSLRRMGLDYFDIFYHHRPDPNTPLEESLGALDTLVKQGKALYAGISNYPGERAGAAARVLDGLGSSLLIHQANYSMLNRSIEGDLTRPAAERGFGIIAFGPLRQGILSGKYLDGIPEDSRAASSSPFLSADRIDDQTLNRVRSLQALAQERGQTLPRLALQWVLRQETICSALIGASRVSQIEENVAALSDPALTAEELARIDAILAG